VPGALTEVLQTAALRLVRGLAAMLGETPVRRSDAAAKAYILLGRHSRRAGPNDLL